MALTIGNQNQRSKPASCVQFSSSTHTRSRDGCVGWRTGLGQGRWHTAYNDGSLCDEPQIFKLGPFTCGGRGSLWIVCLCGVRLWRSSLRSLLRKRRLMWRPCKAWALAWTLIDHSVAQPSASGAWPSADIYIGPCICLLGPASSVQRAFLGSCLLSPPSLAMASVKTKLLLWSLASATWRCFLVYVLCSLVSDQASFVQQQEHLRRGPAMDHCTTIAPSPRNLGAICRVQSVSSGASQGQP